MNTRPSWLLAGALFVAILEFGMPGQLSAA